MKKVTSFTFVITGVLTVGLIGCLTSKKQQSAEQMDFGYFTQATNVGKPVLAGSTVFDTKSQTYTLQISGTNMWGTHDGCVGYRII